MRRLMSVVLLGLLLGGAPGLTASTLEQPLLGQRVSNALFLRTMFCQTYSCRIGTTTITGTGSGDAQELNYRATEFPLANGLMVRLLREPNTRLVSAFLLGPATVPTALGGPGLGKVAAAFFALTLHRPVTLASPEIQGCVRLLTGPRSPGDQQTFWKVDGNRTGTCYVAQRGTPAGPVIYQAFEADLP